MLVFLGVAVSVWGGLHFWTYRNLAALGLPRGGLALLLALLAVSFFVARIGPALLRGRARGFWRAVHFVANAWMGLVFLLSSWFLFARLAGLALDLAGLGAWAQPRPWILAAAAAAVILGARGMAKALGSPRETRYRIDRRARYGLGREYRVAVISDVHLGLILGTEFLRRLVDRINALEPDVVAIVGDFLDPEFPDDDGAARELARLRPREGVFAVTGNHEFYAGVHRFLAIMESAGVTVLGNAGAATASGLQVAGIHDQTAGRDPGRGVFCDPARALAGIDPARPSLYLAHQPKELEAAIARRVDLVLSGHTHAGQIFPFRALVRLVFRHVAGLHRLGPDTELVVCTGTGFWGPPMRVGTDSQLVVITLSV